ncbi:MAG TPA: F0F1 ATP synthase subunit delta [Gammaproteobacteria bacterium]|jgi:F-type H+-transporting ATPase subunit delta|nr:F0F1 ATP synthase subunit delta [Gammaproteobacteria bacterium]|tara:strand:- start:5920 stop:6459 length:540 start_codon:yes stop_codon:yes gene_type:complete
MAEIATLARPYARATFDLAKQNNELQTWSNMLTTLNLAIAHGQVHALLESPDFPAATKAYRLAELCGSELNDQGKKFLQALAENDRLPLLGEIRAQFEQLLADEEMSVDVTITSAFPLSNDQSEKLTASLKKRLNKEIIMQSVVDSSLVGGAIIRAGDVVIDGSLKGRLTKLVDKLIAV